MVGISSLWGEEQGVLELRAPEILSVGTWTFLDEEAGMSAYVNVGQAISLAQAKIAFVGLEKETADYIVGSLRPSNYTEDENEEVHCFVHKDGWILTYYTRDVARAKIFDRRAYKADQSKVITMLENGITKVCNQISVTTPSISYYDFKFPNANSLMLVVDGIWGEGWEMLYLTIPNVATLTTYETSWSHSNYDSGGSKFELDDLELSSLGNSNDRWLWQCARFNPSLSLNTKHKIELWHDEDGYYGYVGEAFIAIAIVYYETK
jgi:hypothetical protein